MDLFQFGFFRFHFFWVTLLWPWVGAVGLSLILGWRRLQATRARLVALGAAVAAPFLAMTLAYSTGGFDYAGYYSLWAAPRLDLYRCLLESAQRGDDHRCMIWSPMNPAGLIAYARSIDLSFARYLQTIPIPPAVDPLFSLRDPASGSIEFVDSEVVAEDASGLTIQAGADAQLIVTVADQEAMRQCLALEVTAALRPAQPDVAQVFYLRPDDQAFAPERVATTDISSDGEAWATVLLMISSEEGFASDLRFDPVFYPQEVELAELELRCRMSAG